MQIIYTNGELFGILALTIVHTKFSTLCWNDLFLPRKIVFTSMHKKSALNHLLMTTYLEACREDIIFMYIFFYGMKNIIIQSVTSPKEM